MDEHTAIILSGYTAVLSELTRLLVDKGVLSTGEIQDALNKIIVSGHAQGAKPGFDAAPRHLLAIVDSWKAGPLRTPVRQ